ncbi:MAG: hypothetical protein M3375_02640 [Actinomycetota bacterium]|nr:hypothetical protein [Actinomycetota bacterium]
MFKAVRSLPEKEQQVVLEYLFESGLGPHGETPTPTKGPERTTEHVVREALGPERETSLVVRGALGPGHQLIPVRLSEPQHRLLKDWCAENGFPMAVVLRGLVERFLEEQGRRAA